MYASANLAPARGVFAIVPHAIDLLPHTARGIYVGGAGNVVGYGADGVLFDIPSVPAGSVLPVEAVRILATSTATLMRGFK